VRKLIEFARKHPVWSVLLSFAIPLNLITAVELILGVDPQRYWAYSIGLVAAGLAFWRLRAARFL
jgi:hypothetical protein